jgi:hypothetical protein
MPGILAVSQGRRTAGAGEASLVVSASAYAGLLSLADQAPLDALPLAARTLDRAKTLGYNQIGQVRCTTANRLVADFGIEHADELLRALYAFGLKQLDSGSRDADLAE